MARKKQPDPMPEGIIEAAIRVVDEYNLYLEDDSAMYPDRVEESIHRLADALTREGYVGKKRLLF